MIEAEYSHQKADSNCANGAISSSNAIIRRRIARHYKSSSVLNCLSSALVDPSIPCSSTAFGDFSASTPAHALPRLANAIRSLISSTSAKSSSKPAFVDAGDELIYYSNGTLSTAKSDEWAQRHAGNCADIQKGEAKGQQSPPSIPRQRESVIKTKANHRSGNGSGRDQQSHFWHGQPTTLEQIRALYKSVPNFASLDETEREEAHLMEGINSCRTATHRRDVCAKPAAQPPPVQPQRKRLLLPAHPHQNNAYFSNDTSAPLDALLNSSTKCIPSQHKHCPIRSQSVGKGSPHGSLGSCSVNSSMSMMDNAKSDEEKLMTEGQKKASTDSGYRSRGETPRGKQTEPEAHTEENGAEYEAHTIAISIQRTGRRSSSPPAPHHPSQLTSCQNALPPNFSQKHRTICPSPRRQKPRIYVWTHPISADQLRSTAPIRLVHPTADECREGRGQREHNGKLHDAVAMLVELLVMMGLELRRVTAVLGKCTCRDVGVVSLLFLPTSLAWSAIRNAHETLEHFAKTTTDQSKRWQSLSDRSLLKHLEGGLFLRWMTDCRIGAIVDEKVSLFFAAIFDFLLAHLLLHSDLLPSHFVSLSVLLKSLANSLPHSRNFHLLSPSAAVASDQCSLGQLYKIAQNLPLGQLISADDPSAEIALFGTPIGHKLRVDDDALLALHHFLNSGTQRTVPSLEQWLTKGTLYALQRRASTIRSWDILQAAHLLLPHFDCPPLTASQFFADEISWHHPFCGITKAILFGAQCDTSQLTTNPLPANCSKMFPDFFGWTPICWAIAMEETQLVGAAIEQPNGGWGVRSDDKCIQIGASTGNLALCELLLRAGANPFKCVPLTSARPFVPSQICPSAFAIAASRGDQEMLDLFVTFSSVMYEQLDRARDTPDSLRRPLSADFLSLLRFQIDPTCFALLNEFEKWSFSEAIYLAAETQRWEVALKLRGVGVGWPSVGCWLGALEWAMGDGDQKKLKQLLDEFEETFAVELIKNGSSEKMTRTKQLLFRLLSPTSVPSSVRFGAACALSLLFAQLQRPSLAHLERELSGVCLAPSTASPSSFPPASQIDPKFVDSPDLSDIRFRFRDGQIVFGHRIVLVNASEEFRQILKRPSGLLDVSECDAPIFRLLLEFVYENSTKCVAEMHKMSIDKQFEMVRAAKHFGMRRLHQSAQKVVGTATTVENFGKVYAFARKMDCAILREECERFALGHLVELVGKWGADDAELGTEGRKALTEGMKKQFAIAMTESRTMGKK